MRTYICTDGSRILHTLLVKHYNDLFDRQSSERGKDEVTYVYVGDVFVYTLGLSTSADFHERFLWKSSKLWVLHKDFFLKIGILSPKVYTKNVPNIDVCNFILAPLRTLSIKQVIVVLYYLIGCVEFCTRLYIMQCCLKPYLRISCIYALE